MLIDLTERYTQGPEVSHIGWVIHHTVTSVSLEEPNERRTIDSIDKYHKERRGFHVGVGYHVLVFPSGRAYRVGLPNTMRAHIGKLNHKYAGLAFVGTFRPMKPPTTAALKTARKVIADSGIPLSGGHRDLTISGSGYTVCPGGWDLDLLKPQLPTPPKRLSRMSLKHVMALLKAWRAHKTLFVRRGGGTLVYEIELEDFT